MEVKFKANKKQVYNKNITFINYLSIISMINMIQNYSSGQGFDAALRFAPLH